MSTHVGAADSSSIIRHAISAFAARRSLQRADTWSSNLPPTRTRSCCGRRSCRVAAAGFFSNRRPSSTTTIGQGSRNLLRRNYRWGYSAIETKAETEVARMAWLYRYPRLLIAASMPLSLASAPYIIYCWLRAGYFEPIWQSPIILTARAAYGAGMVAGGLSWLRNRGLASKERRPKWE